MKILNSKKESMEERDGNINKVEDDRQIHVDIGEHRSTKSSSDVGKEQEENSDSSGGVSKQDNDSLKLPISMDVEQLADAMQLGSRFYVIGYSLGGHAIWGSLKHIPHRLAGAALMSPVINHNWPGFPKNLSGEARSRYDVGDRWVFKVAYHAPWLLNWWLSQPFLPSFSVIDGTTHCPNKLDAEYIDEKHRNGEFAIGFKEATQQGIHESLYRDLMVMFGKWKFVPVDLSPPPVSVPVHLFQGDEDGLVLVSLQRYIVGRLKWINYHELPSTGHYLTAIPAFGDRVLKTLLLSNHS